MAGKITWPSGLTLSINEMVQLKSIGPGKKEDPQFIKMLLLMLYTKEEIATISVTGKAAKNIKKPNTPEAAPTLKTAMNPKNLNFIYGNFF